MDGMRVLSIKN